MARCAGVSPACYSKVKKLDSARQRHARAGALALDAPDSSRRASNTKGSCHGVDAVPSGLKAGIVIGAAIGLLDFGVSATVASIPASAGAINA